MVNFRLAEELQRQCEELLHPLSPESPDVNISPRLLRHSSPAPLMRACRYRRTRNFFLEPFESNLQTDT